MPIAANTNIFLWIFHTFLIRITIKNAITVDTIVNTNCLIPVLIFKRSRVTKLRLKKKIKLFINALDEGSVSLFKSTLISKNNINCKTNNPIILLSSFTRYKIIEALIKKRVTITACIVLNTLDTVSLNLNSNN